MNDVRKKPTVDVVNREWQRGLYSLAEVLVTMTRDFLFVVN
jgi:hypothetical protein